MAFNELAAFSIGLELDAIRQMEHPTVCELGNQRLRTSVQKQKLFNKYKINKEVHSTYDFYRVLGFEDYVAIDVNTEMHAIAMDLNTDLETEYNYNRQFSLVTNIGTGEHIFNQYLIFKNIHSLCKEGGYIVNVLPFLGWVDHGFFNFHPNLFTSLAYYNKYEVKHLLIANTQAVVIKNLSPSGREFRRELESSITNLENLMVVVVFKKLSSNTFKVPQQFVYTGNTISDNLIASKYNI